MAVLTSKEMNDGIGVPESPLRISLRVFIVFALIYLFTGPPWTHRRTASYKIAGQAMLSRPPGITQAPTVSIPSTASGTSC